MTGEAAEWRPRRRHAPHGTFNGCDAEVKYLWFRRDDEPEPVACGDLMQDAFEPDDDLQHDARVLALRALRILRSNERRVITLRYAHDMTLREAGLAMGVSADRVRQIEAKAFRRVRTQMPRELDKDIRAFFG